MKIFSTEKKPFFIPEKFFQKFPCYAANFDEDIFQMPMLTHGLKQFSISSSASCEENHVQTSGEMRTQHCSALNVLNGSPIKVDSSQIPPVAFSLQDVFSNAFTVENVHGNRVVYANENSEKADSHIIAGTKKEIAQFSKKYLAIKTADCLPVVFAYEDEVYFIGGITHAGWRGLTSGIIQITIEEMKKQARKYNLEDEVFLQGLKVFLAPAIFGISYECGQDVSSALKNYINKLLFCGNLDEETANIFALCADVKNDVLLSLEVEKFALEHGITLQSKQNIFPDIQLLGALECIICGIFHEKITIFRENTYGHSILPSFRESCHASKTRALKRLWTYLCLP